MTQCSRKRDFRGGSISEFFNTIDVKRTYADCGLGEIENVSHAFQPDGPLCASNSP